MRRLLLALALCAGFGGADAQQQFNQNLATSAPSCAATATVAAVQRTTRNAVTMTVPSAGATVYIGPNPLVNTTTGFPIVAGAALTVNYGGQVFCIVATGTQTLNVVETFP